MHGRQEGPSGSQPEREDMERMAGTTGSGTGATSTGMQDTGTYQQPARPADYSTYGYYRPAPSRSGAALSILAGALAFLQGLAFVIRSHYYHATLVGYAYRWNLHGWGWVLLVLGALLVAGGVSNYLGVKGSRQFAGALAVITAVVAFLVIFYSVVWSIVVVAACAFAAASLLSDRGTEGRADSMGYGAGGQAAGDMSRGERESATTQGQRSHRM